MPSSTRTVGLALLSLVYVGRRALVAGQQVSTCDNLKQTVENAVTDTTTITLSGNIACTETISIASGKSIEIEGGEAVITINLSDTSGFESGSLFYNQGSLTLKDVTIKDDGGDEGGENGIRGVFNTGELNLVSCKFEGLNNVMDSSRLPRGGAVRSNGGNVVVQSCSFLSNVASGYGGAICAQGTGKLTVTDSTFEKNEAGKDRSEAEVGIGGDIYADDTVDLSLLDSTFSGSQADYSGPAVKCCGAMIQSCNFTRAQTIFDAGDNFGAVVSGTPELTSSCARALVIEDSHFMDCGVSPLGQGGALAIFNTNAHIGNTEVTGSTGTGVVFKSNSPEGEHKLTLDTVMFYQNTEGSSEFYAREGATSQATALAIVNNALGDEDGEVDMGTFENVYCWANSPYECEFVYHGAIVDHPEELKCQICNIMGDRQDQYYIDDDEIVVDESSRAVDDGVSSTSRALIIGLSVALGCTLVVVGALTAYKVTARRNARRLMEEMGGGRDDNI